MSYTPHFTLQEQTPAQRWSAIRWAICAGASDNRVPSSDLAQMALRYVEGEIDQAQMRDELLRWYRPDAQPGAEGCPLPPAQLGREYAYAAEMATLLHELGKMPLPQPYIDVTDMLPRIAEVA